jgi:hypothetical protein
MSPRPSASPRTLKHRRTSDGQAFAREHALWAVAAQWVDVKMRDVRVAEGVRPAGSPTHDLRLRLVVDTRLNILDATSRSPWVPCRGPCDVHGGAYAQLIGLNLSKGHRRAVNERLGDVHGCTRLTELAQTLSTAVIQGLADEVIDTQGHEPDARQPVQTTAATRCAATVRSSGSTVRAGTVSQKPRTPRTIRPPTQPPGRAEASQNHDSTSQGYSERTRP